MGIFTAYQLVCKASDITKDQSPEEADLFAKKVRDAGGKLYSEPAYTNGWMYGFVVPVPKKQLKAYLLWSFHTLFYKSRRQRDSIMKKVMKDPRLAHTPESMPFDVKRMIYGGFKTIVDLN